MMMFMMMESQLRFLRFSFLLVCSTALPAFTAAQPSSGRNSSQQDDESLDSATMAILVLVVVSAILFLGSFSLWIQNCCVGSGRPYRRSRSFRSAISFGSGSRFRQSGQDRDSLAESTAGVDKAVIDTFPLMMYSAAKEMKIGVRSLECAVCLSEFSDEELLRLLPSCDHVFHPQCIATWLANHATCPVCRARVIDNRRSPIKKEGNIPLATAINSEDSIPDEAAGDQNSASVSQSSRDNERFALKLPEGVKEQIVKAARLKLKRSASCEHLPGVWSCRRSGGRSDSGECSGSQLGRWLGRSERWGSSVVPSDCLAVKGDDDRFAILPV